MFQRKKKLMSNKNLIDSSTSLLDLYSQTD